MNYDDSMSEAIGPERTHWYINGEINGSYWDQDYKMSFVSDTVLMTDYALYFDENTIFYVCSYDNVYIIP